MGLFDRFRKRVDEVVDKTELRELSAPVESGEAKEALRIAEEAKMQARIEAEAADKQPSSPTPPPSPANEEGEDEDGWEEYDTPTQAPQVLEASGADSEEDWDDWDDEDTTPLPVSVSKKERKRHEKELRRKKRDSLKATKQGSGTSARLKGSKVDLHMNRSTTGRQLVSVKQAPKGSAGVKNVTTEEGAEISIDLGGGVVEKGGRVIKQGKALDELLEELEWVLLESDISSSATQAVIGALRQHLVGSHLRKGANLAKVLEASLKRALHKLLAATYWDFNATVDSMISKGDTPVIIMLVGVNGTGKTTTTAKIAHRMQEAGHTVIAAAADTFRAGAIEQLEAHCEKLGVRCISSQRGGDSASIARDAVESARARNADVVLIDTAGRMTNKTNLMNELQKVHRVTKPHLVLFVGDALAGNDAVEQAAEFQRILDFDGAVLCKLDTDAKGGAALSIAHATSRPIILAGTGQGYEDLKQFDADWLLEQLFI